LEVKKEENKDKDATEKSDEKKKPEVNYTQDLCLKCKTKFPTGTKHECKKKAEGMKSAGMSIDLPFILFMLKLLANFFVMMGFDRKLVALAEQRSGDMVTKFFMENEGKSFAEFTKVEPAKRKVDDMVVN
tara:strand:- start:154 stop:543 length:390 start_codon:yes stop_codon:yes gene_type:complete